MSRVEEEEEEVRGEDNICNANIISSCSMHFMAPINVCVFHPSILSSSSPPPLSSLVWFPIYCLLLSHVFYLSLLLSSKHRCVSVRPQSCWHGWKLSVCVFFSCHDCCCVAPLTFAIHKSLHKIHLKLKCSLWKNLVITKITKKRENSNSFLSSEHLLVSSQDFLPSPRHNRSQWNLVCAANSSEKK